MTTGRLSRGVKIAHLRLIAALEKSGQVSAAARTLSIAQPAASRQMSELEKLSGAALYVRHSHGVTLTAAGRLLAATARRMLSDIDHADEEIAQLASGLPKRVRIGSINGPAIGTVLPVLVEGLKAYPTTEVSVTVDTSDVLLTDLLTDQLDFYVGRVPINDNVQTLAISQMGPERFCLVVRTGHPLLNLDPPELLDCLEYDWVMQPPGGLARHATEMYLLQNAARVPRRIISTTSQLLTMALVEASDVIAPMAMSVARFQTGRSETPSVAILPLAPDLMMSPFSLVRLNERPLSPTALAFHLMIQLQWQVPEI